MVTTVKNYPTNITKAYRLGEIDSRVPFLTDIVPCDNTTAFSAGDVLKYDIATNEYILGAAGAVDSNVVVCIEDKPTTQARVNVLLTGIVCVETTAALTELDAAKLAAAGDIAKWITGVDAANLKVRIVYRKIASKITEGLGKAVTVSGTTDPDNKVLVYLNPPFA